MILLHFSQISLFYVGFDLAGSVHELAKKRIAKQENNELFYNGERSAARGKQPRNGDLIFKHGTGLGNPGPSIINFLNKV